MNLPFIMGVEHGEISVFPTGLSAPCHDWTEDYLFQGFCRLETQVAFLTLQYEGRLEVTIQLENEIAIRPDAMRAIQVPFFNGPDSNISIWHTPNVWFALPEGEYCLVYQTGLKPFTLNSRKQLGDFTPMWNDMWCVLTFVPQSNVGAKILRQDEKLNPPTKLYTTNDSPKRLVRFKETTYPIFYESWGTNKNLPPSD